MLSQTRSKTTSCTRREVEKCNTFGLDGWLGSVVASVWHCWACYLVQEGTFLVLCIFEDTKSFLQNEKTNMHAPNAVLCSLHKVNYSSVESTKSTSPCVFQMSQTTEEWVYFEKWGGECREHRSSSLRRGFRGECEEPSDQGQQHYYALF